MREQADKNDRTYFNKEKKKIEVTNKAAMILFTLVRIRSPGIFGRRALQREHGET